MLTGWTLWLVVLATLFGAGAFLARKDPEKTRRFGKSITTYISSNRFVIELVAPTLLVVVASIWVGRSAHRTARELGRETDRLNRISRSAEMWRSQFQPATAEETAEWDRTKSEVGRLGVNPSEKLMLTQEVAVAAERAGLRGVRVMFAPADSLGTTGTRVVAGTTLSSAAYGLSLGGEGEFRETARAIALFPGSVAVKSVTLSDIGNQMRVSYLLTVYQSPEAAGGQ